MQMDPKLLEAFRGVLDSGSIIQGAAWRPYAAGRKRTVGHLPDPNLSTLARNFLDVFDVHMRNFDGHGG